MLRPTQLTQAFIRGLEARGELVPGAGEYLARAAVGYGDPGAALNAVIEFLESNPRFRNPEAPQRPAEAPARQHLRRLEAGGLLTSGAADRLYEQLAGQLATVPEETATRLLAKHVADRLDPGHLAANHRPGLDPRAAKVRGVLETLRDYLSPSADLDGISRRWGQEFGHNSPLVVARTVLGRLRTPAHAQDLTRDGQPIEIVGDIREFAGQPAAGQAGVEADLRQHVHYDGY